jgi:hypothetical protein
MKVGYTILNAVSNYDNIVNHEKENGSSFRMDKHCTSAYRCRTKETVEFGKS